MTKEELKTLMESKPYQLKEIQDNYRWWESARDHSLAEAMYHDEIDPKLFSQVLGVNIEPVNNGYNNPGEIYKVGDHFVCSYGECYSHDGCYYEGWFEVKPVTKTILEYVSIK